MATHCSILACASYGQRSLVGYSPWGPNRLSTHAHLPFAFSSDAHAVLLRLTRKA